MSAFSEAEYGQFCQRFSNGLRCPKGRQCPFIHKWSLHNAARKEMKLAKLNGNGNGDGNHKESKNESLVHEQDIKVIQMPSTDEKKHQQPDTDATSSKFPRGSHAKQWRKKVTHAQTANPTRDALQAVIAMEAPTLSNTLPNISSHRHSDGHATEGKILDSYLLQPKVEDCILRTIATLSIYDRQGRTKWAKIRGHRRNPSAWNDQSGQLVEGCYTKAPSCGLQVSKDIPSKSKVSRSFPRFAELPFEIRDMIWKFAARSAAYNPRVRLEPKFDHKGQIAHYDVICRSLSPALMRVCQDSRAEAIKHYSKVFRDSTYFDKSAGTIFLDSYRKGEFKDFTESITKQEIQGIENIAVKLEEWSSSSWVFRSAIRKFTNLKRLIFMLEEVDDPYYSDMGAIKLLRKDLQLMKGRDGDSKGPMIILVPSIKVEVFLSREKF